MSGRLSSQWEERLRNFGNLKFLFAFRDIVVKRNKILTLTERYVALCSAQWCAKLLDFKYMVIITDNKYWYTAFNLDVCVIKFAIPEWIFMTPNCIIK